MTPEAVELDLDAAGLASRLLAALIDLVLVTIVLYAVSTVAGVLASAASADGGDTGAILAAVVVAVGLFGVLVVWPTAWEVGTKGRSPGKLALGLRVVTVEGAPIRVRHALVRGLVGLVEIVLTFGIVAVVVALASQRFRRLGDHLAGTVVVRERGAGAGTAQPRRFVPRPGWEPWAARLDTTRLSADDYRLVRSFLLRAGHLPPAARDRLGRQILDRVLPRAGIDPSVADALGAWSIEDPLVAIAAAYQRRFD
ncbi:MAG TPA: RDD family protein [Iamia sp.]|nr:RDD family protein [Iamia sp.]